MSFNRSTYHIMAFLDWHVGASVSGRPSQRHLRQPRFANRRNGPVPWTWLPARSILCDSSPARPSAAAIARIRLVEDDCMWAAVDFERVEDGRGVVWWGVLDARARGATARRAGRTCMGGKACCPVGGRARLCTGSGNQSGRRPSSAGSVLSLEREGRLLSMLPKGSLGWPRPLLRAPPALRPASDSPAGCVDGASVAGARGLALKRAR